MALTQGAWTHTTEGDCLIIECDVTQTASENDAYTLKIPLTAGLDPNKTWTVFANTAAATLDGSTLPVDVYAGYDSTFAVTGDAATIAATAGGLMKADIIADVKAGAGVYVWDPANTATCGVAPYYAFNLDGASTLTAATCHWVVVQKL